MAPPSFLPSDEKPAASSLGVWGALAAFFPGAVEIANQAVNLGLTLQPQVAAVITTVGALVALVGRVRATKKITKLF